MAKTYSKLGKCPSCLHEWVLKDGAIGNRASRSGEPVGLVCPFCGYRGRIRVKREVKGWE